MKKNTMIVLKTGLVDGDLQFANGQLEQPEWSHLCSEWTKGYPETPSNTCNFMILQFEVLRCDLEATATEADFRPNELNTFPLKQAIGE